MSGPRCWWCGTEPDMVHNIVKGDGTTVQRIPEWPPGDHDHAPTPPTPDQLVAAGHTALRRTLENL